MTNGQFAPPLKGPDFLAKWGGQPLVQAARLHPYLDAADQSGRPAGRHLCRDRRVHPAARMAAACAPRRCRLARALPAAPRVPSERASAGFRRALYPLRARARRSPTASPASRPVTEAELDNPAPEDWPAWRRSHLGLGYSPLTQIDTAQRRPADDRLGAGAAAGRQHERAAGARRRALRVRLWRQRVRLRRGERAAAVALPAAAAQKRPRSMGARRSRSSATSFTPRRPTTTWSRSTRRPGRPVWDVLLTDRPGMRIPGGPLAADGVIMQGFANNTAGGGLIVAVDAETGQEAVGVRHRRQARQARRRHLERRAGRPAQGRLGVDLAAPTTRSTTSRCGASATLTTPRRSATASRA